LDGEEILVTSSEWLKSRRKSLVLTQEELALRAGCSAHALRKIESGERRPSKQLAGLLARSLEIPTEEHQIFVKVARGELRIERLHKTPPAAADQQEYPAIAGSTTSQLPVIPTPTLGRQSELSALGRLLGDPQCRLLTLTGPGGIGNTRLAIEVTSQQQALFTYGVCFISLAQLSSSTLMVPTISARLSLTFQGRSEPGAQLLNYLSEKQVLLILENAKHLLDGIRLFPEILDHSPGTKILVTSRESLNLHGQWVFDVHGLATPRNNQVHRVEEYSAVALFVQSAQRAKFYVELRPEDEAEVARICQMVEGMPLGIE
jgi:transcriptional regulator with XRE-family HTH domain